MPGIGGSSSQSPVQQVRALLLQLERGERVGAAGEQAKTCQELLDLVRRWPEEPPEDEAKLLSRLTPQVSKFTEGQQHDIVGAFRPLSDSVGQKLAECATALNRWLAEAPEAEKDRGVHAQKLAELLQEVDGALWFRCYKKCPGLAVKASFLLAAASVIRAVYGEGAPLRSQVMMQPRAILLVRRMAERLFHTPRHGNVLLIWHEGRLERYNRTLWRAARRAADRLRDELQVRLVSALRRATSPVQAAGGKAKPALQLELRPWPMVGCPLAKTFLEFVAQRGRELGGLGKPALSECPPHCLWPQTLRRLLGLLDTFEILPSEPSERGEGLGVVRLRWEAVSALAFKAVGTKPKASAQASPVNAESKASPTPVPKIAAPTGAPARGGAPSKQGGDAAAATSDGRGVASGPTKLVQRKMDWSNGVMLARILRRGLRAGDEEWRQSWYQFCKQRRLSAEVGQAPSAPTTEALAEFMERSMQKLLKKRWARDLMYKEVRLPAANGAAPPVAKGAQANSAAMGAARKRTAAAAAAAAAGAPATTAMAAGASVSTTGSRDGSSSGSESSHSKRKRKRRRKERKLDRMMGYGDYFGHGQKVTPEVMMMNQMMGMSMMMGMGAPMTSMGAPMYMPHGMPAQKQQKKDGRTERERAGERPGDRAVERASERAAERTGERASERTRERSERKPEPTAVSSAHVEAATAAAAESKPLAKEAKKLDWSKRKEAMINADDL